MKALAPLALVAFLSGCQSMGLAPENMGPPSSTNFKAYNDRGQQAYAQMSDIAQPFRVSVGDSIQFAETSYRDNSHKLRYVTGKSNKQIAGQASLESVGGICTYGDTIGTLNKDSLVDYEITVPEVYYQGFDVRVALVDVPSQIMRPLVNCYFSYKELNAFAYGQWVDTVTPLVEQKRAEYAEFKAVEDAQTAKEQAELDAVLAMQEKERKQNAHITKMKRNGEFLGVVQFCADEGYINRRDIPKVRKSLETEYKNEFKQPYEEKYVNQGVEEGTVKITAVAMSSYAQKYDRCTETRYAVGLMKL
ncbi:Lipoprotein [Vibrio crassostreae]|nr:Lipoprotein [Vibrio crassostreae]CAK2766220.1 Lipoprotein [Vibrio crassostreae]CAK2770985.1 Lipoprotein [Vibrio crassostreae]CAK2776419.1 Lipoprotein [Vibrio crassostreae]CAK2777065.1 Lipoprotein [Vibrio crassostreae]